MSYKKLQFLKLLFSIHRATMKSAAVRHFHRVLSICNNIAAFLKKASGDMLEMQPAFKNVLHGR
ncbi:MAG TPA: hypothetical protein VEN30_05270 [Paraburkholderia sp.]|nr:hypothetical protein [Paraburkholderia sp.]